MLRNRTVQPLNEGLREVGLDPDKTLADIHRRDKLVRDRMRGGAGGGAPSYTRPQQRQQPAAQPVTENRDAPAGGEDGVELSEAIRTVRKRRLTSSEKSKGRRARRKTRSVRKAYAKKYRSRMRRKIARRSKMKRKKFGGTAGLEKLHKMGRRIVMSADSALANLREELSQSNVGSQGNSNAFDDAAFNAGLLALHLGEMFEAYGDTRSAQVMFDASDVGADLSEAFEALGEDATELDEAQEAKLQALLQSVVKGLRIYEAMGSPSFAEIAAHVAEGNGDDDEEDDDEGEDDEDDDSDEDDDDGDDD